MATIKYEHQTNGEYCGQCRFISFDKVYLNFYCRKYDFNISTRVFCETNNRAFYRCPQCIKEFGE